MKNTGKLTLDKMCRTCGVTYNQLQDIATEQNVALSIITKMMNGTPVASEDVQKIFKALTKMTQVKWTLSAVDVKIEEDEDAEGAE